MKTIEMHPPKSSPPKPPLLEQPARFSLLLTLAALGPGVLGLAADNDAGGMLSYLMTGGSGHLLIFWIALALSAPATYIVQEIALRVGLGTHHPYGEVLRFRFNPTVARVNGALLHALNILVLITEFVGMGSALALLGIPLPLGVGIGLGVVLAVTLTKRYTSMERILLWVSLGSLAFLPAFVLLHPFTASWGPRLLGGSAAVSLPFLLLSQAGNSLAPWMIYWQQNAVVAGQVRSLKDGRRDIRFGLVGQLLMAVLALATGSLLGLSPTHWSNPLAWIAGHASPWVTGFIAIGIFDAGFLAASTISLASTWMFCQAFWHRMTSSSEPTRGVGGLIHIGTLTLAAAVVLLPHLSLGDMALWAQAMSGLLMPLSLVLLGLVAHNRFVMGSYRLHRNRTILLGLITLGFTVLATLTFIV